MNKFLKTVSIITMLIFLRTGFALSADQIYFYYTDPVGTPVAMSDSGGTVVWRAEYMPFGDELLGATTVPNNKMFVGKGKDSESGFYYFGARYMEPADGRFISPDPIMAIDPQTGDINQLILQDPQRFNLYTYGLNNPQKYIDHDGEFSWAALPALAVGIPTAMLLWYKFSTNPEFQRKLSESMKSQDKQQEVKKGGARTEPRDLEEKLALDEAKSGAGKPYVGKLDDKKYAPKTGSHDKKTHTHDHADGTKTDVHFDVNRKTGERSGFKIKDDTNAKSRGWLP